MADRAGPKMHRVDDRDRQRELSIDRGSEAKTQALTAWRSSHTEIIPGSDTVISDSRIRRVDFAIFQGDCAGLVVELRVFPPPSALRSYHSRTWNWLNVRPRPATYQTIRVCSRKDAMGSTASGKSLVMGSPRQDDFQIQKPSQSVLMIGHAPHQLFHLLKSQFNV